MLASGAVKTGFSRSLSGQRPKTGPQLQSLAVLIMWQSWSVWSSLSLGFSTVLRPNFQALVPTCPFSVQSVQVLILQSGNTCWRPISIASTRRWLPQANTTTYGSCQTSKLVKWRGYGQNEQWWLQDKPGNPSFLPWLFWRTIVLRFLIGIIAGISFGSGSLTFIPTEPTRSGKTKTLAILNQNQVRKKAIQSCNWMTKLKTMERMQRLEAVKREMSQATPMQHVRTLWPKKWCCSS